MATTSSFGHRGASAPVRDPMAGRIHIPPKRTPEPTADRFDLVQFLFSFDGRVSRLQYWLVQIGVIVAFKVALFLVGGLDAGLGSLGQLRIPVMSVVAIGLFVVLLCAVFSFLMVWVCFASVVKRWHDREKSWVWVLLPLVLVVGWLWQLVECGFLPGTKGANDYGPQPGAARAPDELYALFN